MPKPSIQHRERDTSAAPESPLHAVVAISQLDPGALDELRESLSAFKRAKLAGKSAESDYILRAIAELLSPPSAAPLGTDEMLARLRRDPDGPRAATALKTQHSRFLSNYFALKARAGLHTQRDVATAARLSLATVNAIEQGHVKPQFASVQKLASAFNRSLPKDQHVDAAHLMGWDANRADLDDARSP